MRFLRGCQNARSRWKARWPRTNPGSGNPSRPGRTILTARTDLGTSQRTIELGTGCFDWPRYERAYHRFGLLMLSTTRAADGTVSWHVFDRALNGLRGELRAHVLTRRDTYSPECATPAGTTVLLGCGTLHVEQELHGEHWEAPVLVGIEPDGLAADAAWMDDDLLYGLHHSEVTLSFTPDR